jgi:proteasome lid subunit RPN8/RPN11
VSAAAAAALAIPPPLRRALYDHARAAFPTECCGYLVGAAGAATVDAVVPCRNALLDGVGGLDGGRTADAGFVLDGAELFAFARSLASARPARILYHSHPNGRAYLSDLDRQLARGPLGPAYPVQHLVVGVTATAITEVAQYGWDGADFAELARWAP